MRIPNCKDCADNNHGWCKKYNLQKPEAVVECTAAMELEENDESSELPKPRSSKKLKFVQETFSLNEEEGKLLYHAFHFVDTYYYNKKIDDIEKLIANETSEQGLHNYNIMDSETELLDKCIAEQEKFTNLYRKISKYCKGDK